VKSKPKAKPSKPARSKAKSEKVAPAKAEAPAPPLKGGFSKSELKEFSALLLTRKRVLQGDVKKLEDEGCKKGTDAAGDLSSLPMHLADLGTDNFEQDITLGLMEGEGEEIKEIEEAQDRIADGSFGLCEGCRKRIPKDRLKVIPYARYCVPCKKKEEGV
jgi:RNA polymerase-binding transcription factor DksA